jgi:hypothetical protein
VDFGVTDQLLIHFLCFAFGGTEKKLKHNETVHQLFIDIKRAYD